MLNELEEQFVSPEEMSELYKDVEELLAQCDPIEDGYPHVPGEPQYHQDTQRKTTYCLQKRLPSRECAAAPNLKQEEACKAPLFCQDGGRKLLMDENCRHDKGGGTCSARPPVNGAVSVCSPSMGSTQVFARFEGMPNVGDVHARSARNKRHKPAKAPSGMSHAAKSPQVNAFKTGRLWMSRTVAAVDGALANLPRYRYARRGGETLWTSRRTLLARRRSVVSHTH